MHNLQEIHFEVTNHCPHKCLHCSTGMIEPSDLKHLDKDVMIDTFEQIAKLPGWPKIVHLTGGEPLCYPHIVDAVAALTKLGIRSSMFTTGLTDDFDANGRIGKSYVNPKLIGDLEEAGLSEVVFSVHSTRDPIQNEIMQTPSCLSMQKMAIRLLLSHGKVQVKFNCVPMSLNKRHIEEVVLYAREIKAREVRFLRFVPQGNAKLNPRLNVTIEEMVEVSEFIKNLCGKYTDKNFSVVTEGHPHLAKCRPFPWMEYHCQAGKSLAHINLNRDVLPCPAFKQKPEYFAGNLNFFTLENIWINSQIFYDLRNITNGIMDEPCATCHKWQMCFGACAAQRCWSKDSVFASPDPVCAYGRMNGKQIFTQNDNVCVSRI